MTLQEILNAHKGYVNGELNEWKRVRWLAAVFVNAMGNGKKVIQPTALLKLPDDGSGSNIEDEIKKLKKMRNGK